MRLQIRSSTWQKAPKLLDADDVDLTLGHFPEFSSWHQCQTLYVESFLCVAGTERFKKRKHLTLEEYLRELHLLVSPKEDMVGLVDVLLAQQDLMRTVAVSVPNFLIVPFVLTSTELIATLPAQIVAKFIQTWNLYAYSLPFEMLGFSVDMLWHSKNNHDPGHLWLRNLITQLCSK